ncbi:MAG: GNAT family N-acetyltransferase [Bacteroidota bacterium]
MIHYLKHTGIDKNRWDDCINKSHNRRIYAFSWYLDLVCPGWEALVEDDYTSVFPLTGKRKWAISYLYQPFFAQQLGIFSPGPITEVQLNGFIKAIPSKFRFVEIHLNVKNNFKITEGELTQRLNHELDLAVMHEELKVGYSQNTRRNLRKAQEMEVALGRVIGADELICLFRENYGNREGKLKALHYDTIRKIINHCLALKTGYILGAFSDTGLLSAAAFFLFDQNRVYFLFAASSPEARENGAMFLLIDRFIAENAQKSLILDFEGGNDQNLGRFYKSFGALEVFYPSLRMNRLPIIVDRALYFARKIR